MSQAKAPEPRTTLDPERVAHWLARHPDFFVGREGLLQQLKVPHPQTQGAISLLERLVHDLRERAETAEWRLEHLLETARHNEAQYQRTRSLILALLESESVDALGEALSTQLSERFRTQAVALWLEPGTDGATLQPPRFALDTPTRAAFDELLDGHNSRCTRLPRDTWQHLLPHTTPPDQHGSCAVTRLTVGEPLGYLLLASQESEHFRATLDTLFTDYLGEIVGRLLVRLDAAHARRG
ncbi:DUF484 family protein [Chromohalobacter israelensis]|uniref:DUF484 family protein n=1 Tax=Chromohalobacter israelensis TaxID=141390 RepID=UPI001CC3D9CD|nr:DUF484 family protein [Chromohalobacter salexigens]MBZ5874959.1 DUF484 family protein [Chromohalobacter salexigens]